MRNPPNRPKQPGLRQTQARPQLQSDQYFTKENEPEAEVDSGGVESIEALSRINGQRVGRVQRPGNGDQRLGEIGKDPPVPILVGFGQSGAGHRAASTLMIELPTHGVEAVFDIAEALAVRKLSEGHR